jgi:hypothetical protein
MSEDRSINHDVTVVENVLTCSECHENFKPDQFSKKGRKMASRGKSVKCKKCSEAEQKMLSDLRNCMFSSGTKTVVPNDRSGGKDGSHGHNNSSKNITLKHECEIITANNNTFFVGEHVIAKELKALGQDKLRPGSVGLMVLDLHNTVDLFMNNKSTLKSLAEIREKFGLVVVLSFVGKGDGPGSTRSQARRDIQELINLGVADFGTLVFQRGPAKGWMCDTLSHVFDDRGIYFSDDSDDHLESVKKTVTGSRLLDIHQSDPRNPSNLYKWIFKCANNANMTSE